MEWKQLKRVAGWQAFDGAGNCATVLRLTGADFCLWLVVDPDNNGLAEGEAKTLEEAKEAAERAMAEI